LIPVESCQVVERVGNKGMHWSQLPFPDVQRLLIPNPIDP
jgi:hypothetical protein